MIVRQFLKAVALVVFMLGFAMGTPAWAEETSTPKNEESKEQSAGSSSVEADVASQGKEEVSDKRKALVKEAIKAYSETKKALKELEDARPKDALAALAKVVGQLEILVARDPELAFVPIDVQVTVHDIYADRESINHAKEQAEDFLEDGDVQHARLILSGLASEQVIRTISLPLATYPDAIKAVIPLIDEGNIEDAKKGLQAVLQTLVVTDKEVIPLPIVRAEALIKKADQLAQNLETPKMTSTEKSKGADESDVSKSVGAQKEQLLAHLEQARQQLHIAKALGYGVKGYGVQEDRYNEFEESIATIEEKVQGEKSTQSVFESLKKQLSDFRQYLFEA